MTPAEFAQLAAEYVRAQGETRPVSIDLKHHRLVLGDGREPTSFVFLGHAAAEYEAAGPGERERVLSRRVWSSIRQAEGGGAANLERRLLPRVRDSAWFSAVRRQAELELGADETAIDDVMLPHGRVNDELSVHLAFELATSVSEVGPDRLEAWGRTFDDLLKVAVANLKARSTLPFEEAAPGVFLSPFHDGLDASRVLLPELFAGLKVKGRPVVLAPTHDLLFCAGDEDEAGLVQISTWAEEALLEPRAHCAIAFRLEADNTWKPWLPARTNAAWPRLRLLELQTVASAYARQKEVLEALLQANGHDLTVATLRAFRTPDGGIYTACAWLENVEVLLPRTDRIDFVRVARDGSSEGQVWSTSFEVALKTVGNLMQPSGDLPERYKVTGFPTPAQLEEMVKAGALS